jgi:hypothetical protein
VLSNPAKDDEFRDFLKRRKADSKRGKARKTVE